MKTFFIGGTIKEYNQYLTTLNMVKYTCLHIAYQKVTILVFGQLSVQLDQFLKFEGGHLLITTWNINSQSLKS